MIESRRCPACASDIVYAVPHDLVYVGRYVAIDVSCGCRSCGVFWQSLDLKNGKRIVYDVARKPK